MKTSHLYKILTASTICALGFSLPARADRADDATTEAATFDADAATRGQVQVSDSMARRFSAFAGSEENAKALVAGLRTGSAITLTTTVDGQTSTSTFTPATGQQGYGNVFLSLALAQQELAAQGITHPTAEQIQAALNGGSINVGTGADTKAVQLTGVLALRANGEGWGKIAQQLDVKLGRVVSDLRSERDNIHRFDRENEKNTGELNREKAETLERAERVEPIDRPERPERPEQIERPEMPERPSR